ncbi:RusA family crossover junction endodeoxyribonuclease [bacterium]|nr:RusA family crossover junction endodeoxyribonuclease [bacterium]
MLKPFIKFSFLFKPKPKPRGNLGAGYIYHSSASYNLYNRNLAVTIQNQLHEVRIRDYPIFLGVYFQFPTRGVKDLDNLAGGIMDGMTKAGLILDDSVNQIAGQYLLTGKGSQYTIVVISQYDDRISVVKELEHERELRTNSSEP